MGKINHDRKIAVLIILTVIGCSPHISPAPERNDLPPHQTSAGSQEELTPVQHALVNRGRAAIEVKFGPRSFDIEYIKTGAEGTVACGRRKSEGAERQVYYVSTATSVDIIYDTSDALWRNSCLQ